MAGKVPKTMSDVQSMTNAAPVSDQWLRDISVNILEFEDDSVEVRIYIAGELFTRKRKPNMLEASIEVGASIIEEAK